MLPVSRALQAVAGDVIEAMTSVNSLLDELKSLRCEEQFHKLYEEADILAHDVMDITLKKPRTAPRSSYRPAAQSQDESTENYYRINYFYPGLIRNV